jgi:hypothetical protein
MAIKLDSTQAIDIYQNDSYDKTWLITHPVTGAAIDFTGGITAKLTINSLQNPPDDTTKISQVTGTGDASGNLTFTLPALALPDGITPVTYYYDIELTGTTWGPMTLFKGKYTITDDITKS